MPRDAKEHLKELWKKEIVARKEASRWSTLSNIGFIGLVGTELPEFLAKDKGGKPAWRLPLFVASSASIVVGVVMNWIKGNQAETMRESTLMIEHDHSKGWSEKIEEEQQNNQQGMTK